MLREYTTNANLKNEFECHFTFKGKRQTVVANSHEIFTNGFWVNGEQIDKELAGKVYWINPTNIHHIEAEIDERSE